MILVSALLSGAVALAPIEPVEPPELIEPGAACIAPAVPSLYLGGPLRGCPEPRQQPEPKFLPLGPQSLMDE